MTTKCHVCESKECLFEERPKRDAHFFNCSVCGQYLINSQLLVTKELDKLTPEERISLAGRVRAEFDGGRAAPELSPATYRSFIGALPDDQERASTLVKFVQAQFRRDGKGPLDEEWTRPELLIVWTRRLYLPDTDAFEKLVFSVAKFVTMRIIYPKVQFSITPLGLKWEPGD